MIVLRKPCKVIHEILELILPCVVLSLQCQPAVLSCLILESLLRVGLCQIKQSKSVIVLKLLVIYSSLVKEAEGSSLGLKGTVMVHVFSWGLAICSIGLRCLSEAAQSLLDVLAIDEAQSQHVVYDYEVLRECMRLERGKLFEASQRPLVAACRVAVLLDLIIELAEHAVGDEMVPCFI